MAILSAWKVHLDIALVLREEKLYPFFSSTTVFGSIA